MKCSVCKKQRHDLTAKKSKLMGNKIIFCNSCYENGYEPRHIIILIGRSKGIKTVDKYLKNRLYVGEEIKATEFV